MPTQITLGLTAGQIVNAMYHKLGVVAEGQVVDNAKLTWGLLVLNLMLKAYQAKGINLWRQTQTQLVIPPAASFVTITPQVIGVEDCRWVEQSGSINQFERPMGYFSYQEYMSLPNKNQQSLAGPTIWMYDRQRTQSNLYFWPQAQQQGLINTTVVRIIANITGASDTLDVPDEWMENMIYGGAMRLMTDYGVSAYDPQTAQHVIAMATSGLSDLESFDRADSIKIKPWGRRGTGKFWR